MPAPPPVPAALPVPEPDALPVPEPAPPQSRKLRTPRAVLVGPPGAGKTTVGRLLAGRLGVDFLDTDDIVEAAAGCSVAEIFVDQGEPRFRELEREAVIAALATHPGVLALGGGSILDPATRADLVGHRVVFLEVGISDAARRIGFNRDRPLLLGNPRAQWLRLMEARRPLYEEVAAVRVVTDGTSAIDVATAALDALAALEQPQRAAADASRS